MGERGWAEADYRGAQSEGWGEHSCADREGGGHLAVQIRSGPSPCSTVLFHNFLQRKHS